MSDTRTCPAPGCGAPVQKGKFMCRPCWFSVPAPLRAAVNRTWRAFTAARRRGASATESGALLKEYRGATEAAIAGLLETRP